MGLSALRSGGQWAVAFELVHYDLALYPCNGRVGQQNVVDKVVKGRQICAIHTKQIIGIAGHCPCACYFWAAVNEAGKAGGVLWPMGAKVDLNEALYSQAQPVRVKPRDIALYIPIGFQPLLAAPDLTGGQVQHVAEFLRSQVCVLL